MALFKNIKVYNLEMHFYKNDINLNVGNRMVEQR